VIKLKKAYPLVVSVINKIDKNDEAGDLQ